MAPNPPGRRSVLSRDAIVAAAVDLLDRGGVTALTFRALAAHLATGAGALYWHVADKDALLRAAAETVVERALAGGAAGDSPAAAIRAVAVDVHDALERHPWLGAQLAREPWQPAMLEVLERVGGPLIRLGVPPERRFHAATAMTGQLLGLAAQHAAVRRNVPPDTDRPAVLTALAEEWRQRDPAQYPFLREVAGVLADHDDREQFLAGVDLLLAGITAD